MRKREILIRVPLPAPRRRLVLAGIGALLCVSAAAYAAIVDFNTSETLTKTKLNGNFHDLDDRSWSGTGAVRYFTGGSVGVGLSAPASTLGVSGGVGTGTNLSAGQLSIQNSTSASLLASLVFRKGDGTPLWELGNLSGANQYFYLHDNVANATRMLINSSTGNISIGSNTTPSAALDVLGHIRAGFSPTPHRGMEFWTVSVNAGTTCDTGCGVGSSRVDLQACKLEYSIVSPK